MELILSPRRNNAIEKADARALAIRSQYGDINSLAERFSIKNQAYCARNVEKAIRKGVPTFASIIRTYGEDGVAGLIGIHITDAILRMGEDSTVDSFDVDFIARAICESDRFRLLSMASILGFFHLLKCGEFDIYGRVTPRKVLEAFRKYAEVQQTTENRIRYEIEKEREAKEREEHRSKAVPWEVWAKRNGIDPALGVVGYVKQKIQEGQRKTPAELFASVMDNLVRVIGFICDMVKRDNRAIEKFPL